MSVRKIRCDICLLEFLRDGIAEHLVWEHGWESILEND